MKNTPEKKREMRAEQIARMADRGEDISRFFTNDFKMMPPLTNRVEVQRVTVDFTAPMLQELDREASAMNISRQAVIKTLVRRALDERYMAVAGRGTK
jgi:ABC-type hemin transport system ATPase subunit